MKKHAKKITQPELVKQKQHNWRAKLFYGSVMGFATIATILAIFFIVPVNSGQEDEQHVIDIVRKKTKVTHPIEKGLENLLQELSETDKLLLTGDGIEERINALTSGDIAVEYSLNISNAPALDGATIGADGTFMRSVLDKKMYLHSDISVSRMEMLIADVYGEADNLYLCLPEITGTDSILLQTQGIDKQFNQSRLSEYMEQKIPMEISVSPYETYPVEISDEIWLANMLKEILTGTQYREVIEADNITENSESTENSELKNFLLEHIQNNKNRSDKSQDNKEAEIRIENIEKLDSEQTIIIGEEELTLRGYNVTLENVEGNFEIALDKNEKIRSITFPENLPYESVIIQEAKWQFLGKDTTIDVVNMDATFSVDPNVLNVEKTKEVSVEAIITDTLALTADVKDDNYELSFASDIQGFGEEQLEIAIDYLTIKENDNDVIKMTGTVNVTDDASEMPVNTGKIVDVLHMDDWELFMTFVPWSENIEKRYAGFFKLMEQVKH